MCAKKTRPQAPAKKEPEFENRAFSALKAAKSTLVVPAPKPQKPVAPPAPEPAALDEDELFLRAVSGAAPIKDPRRVPEKTPPESRYFDEDTEAELELLRLVNGELPFDLVDSDEYIEGNVRGLPSSVMKRLRKGEFAIQAQLDLHGLTRPDAREAVEEFIRESVTARHRLVLIVHGRGLHSKDQLPILKESVRGWFSRGRGPIGSSVLAFTSARPEDGGLGAMYVLLRRNRPRPSLS